MCMCAGGVRVLMCACARTDGLQLRLGMHWCHVSMTGRLGLVGREEGAGIGGKHECKA